MNLEDRVKAQLGDLVFANLGLSAEIDASRKRIAELEAELAKLKKAEP